MQIATAPFKKSIVLRMARDVGIFINSTVKSLKWHVSYLKFNSISNHDWRVSGKCQASHRSRQIFFEGISSHPVERASRRWSKEKHWIQVVTGYKFCFEKYLTSTFDYIRFRSASNKLTVAINGVDQGVVSSPALCKALVNVYVDKNAVSTPLIESICKKFADWLS